MATKISMIFSYFFSPRWRPNLGRRRITRWSTSRRRSQLHESGPGGDGQWTPPCDSGNKTILHKKTMLVPKFFFSDEFFCFLGTCWYLVQNPQTTNDSCYSVTSMAEIANYSELFDFRGNGDCFSWNLLKTIDILAPFLPGKQMTQSLRRRTTSWRTSRAGVGT